MDPEKRTLKRIELDDAVRADEIFTLLMGEKVEPRRSLSQGERQVRGQPGLLSGPFVPVFQPSFKEETIDEQKPQYDP